MLGAYLAWFLVGASSTACCWPSWWARCSPWLLGWLLEWLLFRHFYHRDHLDQVLLTFGLIYIFEEVRSILWGDDVHAVRFPRCWLARYR